MTFTVDFMRISSRGCNESSVFQVLDWLSLSQLTVDNINIVLNRCIRSLFMLPLLRRQTQCSCNPALSASQTPGINHPVGVTNFDDIALDKMKKITALHFHSLDEEWSHRGQIHSKYVWTISLKPKKTHRQGLQQCSSGLNRSMKTLHNRLL